MNHFVRKYIYRAELQYIFTKYTLPDPIQNKIATELFLNFFTPSKLLILKENLTKIEEITALLSSITSNPDLVKEVEQEILLMSDDLEIPPDIKSVFSKNEKVALFIGAGVSSLLGLPLWQDLANKSIRFLFKKGIINHFEAERIINEVPNPKQKLTIFHQSLEENKELLKEFYTKELSCEKCEDKNPYEILAQFDCLKVTSNVDDEFFKVLKKPVSKKPTPEVREDSSLSTPVQTEMKPPIREQIIAGFDETTPLSNDLLYQIHGSISDMDSMRITTRQYLEAYAPESGLSKFLSNLFRNYRVIFIGYSLEEFELLHNLLPQGLEHFVLLPMFQSEVGLFRAKQKYYKNLKITPIHYYLDVDGYTRLINVLESWISTLNQLKTAGFYEKAETIDRIVD